MPQETLIADQIIHGEKQYAQAIDLILSKAQRQLLIFDQDLSHGDFAGLAVYQRLNHLLSSNPASEIKIILQNTDFFQAYCPRLNALLKTYQHRMCVRVTDDSVKNMKSCFIVADSEHYLKRMHIDQARFKFACNDRDNSEIMHNQFLALEACTTHGITTTTLGL